MDESTHNHNPPTPATLAEPNAAALALMRRGDVTKTLDEANATLREICLDALLTVNPDLDNPDLRPALAWFWWQDEYRLHVQQHQSLWARDRRETFARLMQQEAPTAPGDGVTLLGGAFVDAMREIEQRSKTPGAIPGLATGLADLDAITEGLVKGEVTVIAGRPSMGKTALALQLAEHVAAQGGRVLFVSLEMSAVEIARRLLSGKSGVALSKLRRGDLGRNDAEIAATFGKLNDAANRMASRDRFIVAGRHVQAVETMRELCGAHDADLLVVDYLQLLGKPKAENRQLAVAEISRGLKLLAMERAMPVLAVSQLNRQAESRKDNRPQLADLRESGAIEQDADLVMLLYRADYYDAESADKGKAEVIVAKNRNGATGVVTLAWRGEVGRFDNLAHPDRTPNGRNPHL